ncbi:CPBP family intramembrane glutamic endopeptidase [Peptoniphilus sp. DNF00840]|uniref:CPBP family intramembrane glutamic endopeptidase n=1 Tax=Peptoniphilus sp. DNF00840 TaxID=1477000 RepID=UPI00079242CC|nr:CPBP family intramembrane glutamic endopeptidase [Peptoniphilus sp. DNF00840]KXB69554.1 CAAX amino terminal protease family protein [Peptoniphilus sp. DNF00840]
MNLNKYKRRYPSIEAKTWKWVLSFILSIGSFFLVSLIFELLGSKNEILIALLISALCLVALWVVDRQFILKIFLPLKMKDILYILLGLGFSFVAVILASIAMAQMGIQGSANPIFDILNDDNIKRFIVSTMIQFIAEEIIFIIPFLFVINKLRTRNEKLKTLVAILVSSLIFGAMHLTTYNFNILQAVLVISIIRTGLTMSYVLSKNLTVTYLVHMIYDWALIWIYLTAGQMA